MERFAPAALQRVKQRLSEREFQIFDCYALQQWPVKEVAETLDVKEAYIYVIKSRVAKQLKEEVKRLTKKMV